MASGSTALVPMAPRVSGEPQPGAEAGRGSGSPGAAGRCGSPLSGRSKWLLALSVVLAIAAAVLGSIWFGIAAVLPFLYVAPCLAMAAMCMKGMKGNSAAGPGAS